MKLASSISTKLVILTVLELLIILAYGAVAATAIGSQDHFFLPELFGPQLGFACFLLLVPITGLMAVMAGSAEYAFWHALFSASGIAVSATAAILAAYGVAIGKSLQEYYMSYPARAKIWGTDGETYADWIIGAPVVCMVFSIAITILLPFSYFTVVNGHNKYNITDNSLDTE